MKNKYFLRIQIIKWIQHWNFSDASYRKRRNVWLFSETPPRRSPFQLVERRTQHRTLRNPSFEWISEHFFFSILLTNINNQHRFQLASEIKCHAMVDIGYTLAYFIPIVIRWSHRGEITKSNRKFIKIEKCHAFKCWILQALKYVLLTPLYWNFGLQISPTAKAFFWAPATVIRVFANGICWYYMKRCPHQVTKCERIKRFSRFGTLPTNWIKWFWLTT